MDIKNILGGVMYYAAVAVLNPYTIILALILIAGFIETHM